MTAQGSLHLFEGFGVELEYMIVDRSSLDVLPAADEILRAVGGAYLADVECGDLGWSNEFMLHVIELKTNGPVQTLRGVAAAFHRDVGRINQLLEPMHGRLMPTGMHPWMDPDREARRWPHEFSPIYEAFDRIFDCKGHGWANLQSVHLNLPFAGDNEFARLHAAIRLVLPILPALAASSPIADARVTPFQDYRLEVYRTNAVRVPSVAGRLIPEPLFTRKSYQERLLKNIYRDIEPFDPEGILQHEWLNARGAIARFERSAIELRLLDMQECPEADLAIAAFIARLIRSLVEERWVSLKTQKAWAVEPLEKILLGAIADGDQARIADRAYLELFGMPRCKDCTVQELWMHLAESILPTLPPQEREMLAPLNVILNHGPLSRRILRALGGQVTRKRLHTVYGRLCDCLAAGKMFDGHV